MVISLCLNRIYRLY